MHSGDISSASLYVGMAFAALVFTASLGFLVETFFKLLNEEAADTSIDSSPRKAC